jgi:hypothetical protein
MHLSATRAELDKISELLDLRLSSDGKQVRPELDDDFGKDYTFLICSSIQVMNESTNCSISAKCWSLHPICQTILGAKSFRSCTSEEFHKIMELAKLTLTKDKKKRTWMMEKITRKEISLKLIHAGEDEIDNLYQKLKTT